MSNNFYQNNVDNKIFIKYQFLPTLSKLRTNQSKQTYKLKHQQIISNQLKNKVVQY